MKHKPLLIVLIIMLSLVALGVVSVFIFWKTVQTPKPSDMDGQTVEMKVPSGMSVQEVADELESRGLVRFSKLFYAAVRFNLLGLDDGFELKSGVYELKIGSTMKELAEELEKGRPETISVSIPEGLTIKKISLLLEENNICNADAFVDCCYDKDLLAEYDIPASSFQGYLFPDTYFFNPNSSAEEACRKLVDTFFLRVETIPELKGLSPEELHQKLILASIVEREYRVAEEAPLIASVFTNRLKIDMGLYSCATIEYIITEIEGKPHPTRITYEDLESESMYNTYKWRGLPPGPISNPGMVALRAAAKPADTPYYYFVLTNPDAGTHSFTETFVEHKEAENMMYTKD
ncbi:MAG: endolytic transglycosylase MltG [Treponema sp.]|nr:endolytic transglycosylase MltG [Treponema sp.]